MALAIVTASCGPAARIYSAGNIPRRCSIIGGYDVNPRYPNIKVIYSATRDPLGIFLGAAIVVRASREWLAKQPASRSSPGHPGPGHSGGGATAGPVFISHEPDINTVWIDASPVPLGDNNVLLLDVGNDGIPRAVGTSFVEPRFDVPGHSCDVNASVELERVDRSLWDFIRRSATVRNFMDR
jgi:hypothetical protein